ncbi:MAG: serine/threonine-protein kinase [Gammaproteobacteria bacterium]|nr:serine/threonine-protein kinase [Gammaproteobacteria bacterium]
MEIPGFRIQREVGRGAASIVYLATWGDMGHEVALKVAVGEAAQDPAVQRRLAHESEVLARIDHPHVVKAYEAGTGICPYIALQYLDGGDLVARMGRGMSLTDAVGVAKQVALALDALAGHGIVHRDVKPENILFRGREEAVLTDFGIAAEAGAQPSSATVPGTSAYMSPEQAAGGAVDSRSDLYSLGVVFYLMLTGEAPSGSGDGGTATRGAIRLPESVSAYRGVLARWLHKDPDERFQTGAEVIRALDAVEVRDPAPIAAVRIDPIATGEIQAVAGAAFAATAVRASIPGPPRRRAASVAVASMVVAAIALAGYFGVAERAAIADFLARTGLTEDVALTSAWKSAEALRLDPNQSLAAIVAAYRRVLDRDPAHGGALERISTVAAAWKRDIDAALEADDLALADAKLNESLGVFPQDAELANLFEQLSDRRRADTIMQDTNALLASQGMSHEPSASSATQAYHEVLQRLPDHAGAQMRLNELAGHYAGLAERAVLEGDVAGAMDKLGRAVAANPDYQALEGVRAQIAQAATVQAEIDELLNRASAYRAAAALVDPPEANAAEIYHRVLATDEDNAIARQGLLEIAASALEQFGEFLRAGNLDAAKQLTDRATVVGLGEVPVSEMRTRYDAEIDRLETVARVLAEAHELFADGWLTLPADGGVVARLREVLRLDPDNGAAAELLTRTAQRLASAAKDAHAFNLMDDARLYLDLALTVTPDVDEWRVLREAWAASADTG